MRENDLFSKDRLRCPLRLNSNRVWRPGRGGRELDKLFNLEFPQDSHFPEEWIASTIQARNIGREDIEDEGLSYIANSNIKLKELIEKYPQASLGENHLKYVGDTIGVLAKIIDSSERGTVHVHPDKETARRLFDAPFGKTESIHVLKVREDAKNKPGVYLGFKEGITQKLWKDIFEKQDIKRMLDCLHFFPVKVGDTFNIKAGIPHTVSEGFVFFEMQEPSDYTIRVEKSTSGGFFLNDYQCHQGLGFNKMFECFKFEGLSRTETKERYLVSSKLLLEDNGIRLCEVVGYDDTECFKLYRYEINSACEINPENVCSSFIVMEGEGIIYCAGKKEKFIPGDQFFFSASCKQVHIKAKPNNTLLIFRSYGPKVE